MTVWVQVKGGEFSGKTTVAVIIEKALKDAGVSIQPLVCEEDYVSLQENLAAGTLVTTGIEAEIDVFNMPTGKIPDRFNKQTAVPGDVEGFITRLPKEGLIPVPPILKTGDEATDAFIDILEATAPSRPLHDRVWHPSSGIIIPKGKHGLPSKKFTPKKKEFNLLERLIVWCIYQCEKPFHWFNKESKYVRQSDYNPGKQGGASSSGGSKV